MSEASTTKNGTADIGPEAVGPPPVALKSLPVDSFRDAAPHLRRPFTAAAVKFKVQATWDGGALIVAYIDARLVIDRLNMVIPDKWEPDYKPVAEGLMWCYLTVDGITRPDIGTSSGQGDSAKKGLVSDALKRAAVQFGIGVSLYAIPKLRLYLKDGHLATDRNDKYKLTPNGETRCRAIYEAWLDTVGRASFGDPLDHGDDLDAGGDVEVDAGQEPEAQGDLPDPISPERVSEITSSFGALRLSIKQIGEVFTSAGLEPPRGATAPNVLLAIKRLGDEEADKLLAELAKLAQDADATAPDASASGGGADA